MNAATLFELPAAHPSHPAKYTEILLPVMARMLRGRKRILDPFAGSGKCFLLERFLSDCVVSGVEIEEEWCRINPRTTLGNALHLPWADGYFDAVATSPAYGNRFGDTTLNRNSSRVAYTASLGHKLHPDNSGAMQWSDRYRDFHLRAWREARRVLVKDGAFVLNCKSHYRNGRVRFVTSWHIKTLVDLGFDVVRHVRMPTPSHRYGKNSELRVSYEDVVLLRLERPFAGQEIPRGYCQCGCGQKTAVAHADNAKWGYTKGQPKRYVHQHHFARGDTIESIFYHSLPSEWSDDECWEWQGTRNTRNHYGMLWFDGKSHAAHRVSYEIHHGEEPGDKDVCHTCDNPPCVNPAHLFLGDDQANMSDKTAKGRQAKGETHGRAKLSTQEVSEIRAAFHAGKDRKQLAQQYGIDLAHVYSIGARRSWKDLP